MKRTLSPWTAVTLSTITAAWLLAVPASAQERAAGGGGASHGGGAASGGSVGSSGGGASSGAASSGGGSSAPATSGGSSSGGSSSGGGSHAGGGGGASRSGATGGSGYAAPRGGGGSGASHGGGERGGSVARTNGGSGSGVTSSSGSSGNGSASAAPSGDGNRAVARGSDHATKGENGGAGVPSYARPRDGQPVAGTAVPRGSVPGTAGGGGITVTPGYYGGFYDPWWYGAGAYGAYGGYYGGRYGYGGGYGGYYDPWYGGDPIYGGSDPQSSYNTYADEGSLRLKIKPREGEVYVDGYFVGIVDNFDGIFQRLHIDSGPHRIEVRAPGYEPLAFDVRITPDHKTTYEGELKRIQ